LSEGNNEIDAKLLENNFNPFQRVCETGKDSREQLHEYRAFKDYLLYLKIIGKRLITDLKNYEKITPGDPLRWSTAYELQVDIESFVIFSHILLSKVGILMDKLLSCRNPHQWSYNFSDHKKEYLNDSKMCPQYSLILAKMHWYDQNFDFLRNKIITHGRSLAGSMRNFSVYRKTNASFGKLSKKDHEEIQNFIVKYGEQNSQILSIPPNPNIMLGKFLNLIMEFNVELSKDDLTKLAQIVQRTGAAIDVTVLSKHIRKFLEDIAALFPSSK